MKRHPVLEAIGGAIGIAALIALGVWWSSPRPRPPVPTPVPTVASASPAQVTPVTRHCTMRGLLPDPVCTPGQVNPAVTQDNIHQTICVKGWTATVRPDVTYTEALKRQQMVEYGFTDRLSDHEEDHLIPLELGGAPMDPLNLWPQPYAVPGAHEKDTVENWLNQQVCDGNMTLAQAQRAIATDWYAIYRNLATPSPSSASPSPATSTPVATLAVPTATATIPHAPTWTSIPKQIGRG